MTIEADIKSLISDITGVVNRNTVTEEALKLLWQRSEKIAGQYIYQDDFNQDKFVMLRAAADFLLKARNSKMPFILIRSANACLERFFD